MLSHGDNCRHCRGKMSAPKAVLEGPRIGQYRIFCTKCGHIEYQRTNAPGPLEPSDCAEAECTCDPDEIPSSEQGEYPPAECAEIPPTHEAALAALAQNDPAAAIDEYRKVLESDPDDALAYGEMSRVACEHLGDAPAAVATLRQALDREWPQDEAAFLCMRLADIYWEFLRNHSCACALLIQIEDTMPDTPQAQNARKRLDEILEQIALQSTE